MRAGRVLVAVAVMAVSLVAASSASSARLGEPPVITGVAEVGSTLTSSSPGDGGRYRWQRCDPDAAACADGDRNDPDWVDINGADAKSYTIPAADHGFLIRVLSKDTKLGTQFSASASVGPVFGVVEPPAEEDVPQHGVQVIAELTGGSIRFKPPGQTGFNPLTETTPIPVGSVVDARKGVISVTAATGALGDTTKDQKFKYSKGLFKVLQTPAANSLAIAKLIGKLGCKSKGKGGKKASEALATTSRKRRRRRLWGSGRGRYGTRGKGGTGSVVGTKYLTVEKCGGTLFKVPPQPGEGHGISVDPKGKKKPIFLAPGESYFAKAP